MLRLLFLLCVAEFSSYPTYAKPASTYGHLLEAALALVFDDLRLPADSCLNPHFLPEEPSWASYSQSSKIREVLAHSEALNTSDDVLKWPIGSLTGELRSKTHGKPAALCGISRKPNTTVISIQKPVGTPLHFIVRVVVSKDKLTTSESLAYLFDVHDKSPLLTMSYKSSISYITS